MSRSLKFRAWLEDFTDNKWKMVYDVFPNEIDGEPTALWGDDGYYIDGKECKAIMQYTGLKDKNGKEIYEGDILKWLGHEVKAGKQIRPERYFEVKPDIEGHYKAYCLIGNGVEYMGVEIIGNIYENPELIKEK